MVMTPCAFPKRTIALIKEYNENFKPKGLIWRIAENYEAESAYRDAGKIVASGKIGNVTTFRANLDMHVPIDNEWSKTAWRATPDVSVEHL